MPTNPQPTTGNRRTYLVTGAAGFIASKVCEQLLEAGHTVVGVDNLNDYYDVRLKDWRLSRLLGAGSRELGADPKISGFRSQVSGLTHEKFTFYHLDIENLPALEALFSAHRFDAVFNLAARAGVRYSLEFPELYRRTNVLGEENVLKCQVKYGVKKHVLASSSSVYAGCPMPFVEDAVLGKMQSPYAETKRQAELLALDYHRKHGIDVTALRYFTVFGPAGRPDMAPFRFIKWIDEGTPITLYGDGTQARDFTYVDDIARGTILAGRLFGGQLVPQKPETGNLKPEGSDPKSSLPSTQVSGFRSQVSVEAPRFDIVNLGGGNNPLSITAMIGIIEEALSSKRSAVSSENPQVSLSAIGQAKAEGLSASVSQSENRGQTPSGQQPATARSQVSRKAIINRLPSSPADMQETWADISKAGLLLGWSPQTAPMDGFYKAVTWQVANREWLKAVKT